MEIKKREKGSESEQKAVWILKSLLCSYVVTGILLLLLTLVFYKMELKEGVVTGGIIGIYVLSTFVGGFAAGKLARVRKFIWGLTIGILYFALLMVISLGLYRAMQGSPASIVTTFLLCAAGGMAGGMLS